MLGGGSEKKPWFTPGVSSSVRADEVDVLMLPAGEEVHRRGVDFLHDAKAPALRLGAGNRHGVRSIRAAALSEAGLSEPQFKTMI